MNTINNKAKRFALLLLASLSITACGGGGGGGDDVFSTNGGTVTNSNDPNVINGFDLSTASLTLSGPISVGTGSTSNFTATLLDSNGIPPASPPGIPVELDVTAGTTNPPGSARTDNNGDVDFTFLAPNNGNNTVVRARIRNRDGELARNQGVTVNVRENIFQIVSPPDNTQVRLDASREIRLNWLVGNDGATTGDPAQGNPGDVELTLQGRVAGGGFSIGGAPVQEPARVDVANGQFAKIVEVVAGDTGGPVNIVASTVTNGQNLRTELPIEFVGAPARIDPTPTNIRLEQQEATPLNVRVFDENSTPLSNIPLRFSISICVDNERDTTACSGSGEQITTALRTTDATGRAATGFIAGDAIGGGEIEITVDSGPGAGLERAIVYNVTMASGDTSGGSGGGTSEATQTFTSPTPGTQIPVGETREVAFNLSNNSGPVANQSITFSITRGLIDDDPNAAPAPASSRTFTSDSAGNINFQISSNDAGVATLDSGSAQLNVEFTQEDIGRFGTSVSSSTIAQGESITVVATAFDGSDNPLPGAFVQFVLDTNEPGGSVSPANGTTNAQGRITTTYTANTGTGAVRFRTTNQDQTISFVNNFQVTSGSTSNGASFTFVNNDGRFSLNEGNAVSFNLEGGAPAASNQQVTISTTRGQVDDDLNGGPAPAASRIFTTNNAGDIDFQAISSTRGPATISASGPNGASAQVQVQFIGTPASITADPASSTIAPNQSQPITATVRDSSGGVLSGVLVTFRVDNDSSGGSLTSESVTTNEQGQANTAFTAGPNTGNVSIRSTANNQQVSATTTINVTGTATGGSANGQFTAPDNGQRISTNQFRGARFALDGGSSAAGEQVTFMINRGVIDEDFGGPADGAATRTLTADADGIILFSIRSSDPGQATLQSAGGESRQVQFVRPASIDLQANPQTLQTGEVSVLNATVRDAGGNPVPGARVQYIIDFDASGGNLRRTDVVTANEQGEAGNSFTAGSNTGTVELRTVIDPANGANDQVTLTVQ